LLGSKVIVVWSNPSYLFKMEKPIQLADKFKDNLPDGVWLSTLAVCTVSGQNYIFVIM
jgi:hypothetical protein